MSQKVVGFFPGVFDLVHAGHVLAFEYAKMCCDYLIVGLQEDPTIDRLDKNKPIMSVKERQIILDSIKWIDKVIIYKTENELKEIQGKLPISIRFVGEDWRGKEITGWMSPERAILKQPKLVFLSRSHGYSSTELRNRIKNG